jgi:hypothetical protein
MLGPRLCRCARVAWPQRASDTATSGGISVDKPLPAQAQASPSGRVAAPTTRGIERRPGHIGQRPLDHRVLESAIGGRPRSGGRPDDLEPGGLERGDQRPGRAGVVDDHGARLPPLGELDQAPDHPADAGAAVDDLDVA